MTRVISWLRLLKRCSRRHIFSEKANKQGTSGFCETTGRICGLVLIVLLPAAPCLYADVAPPAPMEARGIIVAKKRPVISSEIAGKIEKLPFLDGEAFKKGDILVAFDQKLLQAQQSKAEAELKGAVLKLENYRELERLESIGTLDVALAAVEVERLRAESRIAAIALERCRVKAPFNGRVVELMVAEHESVSPNQKLLEIISTEKLEVEVMVPVAWLSRLTEDLDFSVYIDSLATMKNARIATLGATVDPVSGLLKFRGTFSEETTGLLPGMIATVSFPELEKHD